jgi:glutamate dehydrogenase
VDGSGVVHDPDGLDRGELLRLATQRKMVSDFDVSKLGPKGFRVLTDQKTVTLPGACPEHHGSWASGAALLMRR